MIFFATSRHTAITPCASGAQAVPLARSLTLWPCWSPTGWPTIISVTRCPLRCPPPWKVEILASDISYSVLRAAQQGVYSEPQMSSVDFSYRLRYFDKIGERYAVKRALKEVIHFDFHNLKTEYLPQRNDVIFCRNVMMYFDEAEQKRLIDKFWS